ncbi:MAG: redoxin domain-containing protein [Bacteroidaceae bacterium]|nr:redoxin domain-containing protein [Bacteroidaceae bacterium]
MNRKSCKYWLPAMWLMCCVATSACAGEPTGQSGKEEKGSVIALTDSAFRAKVFDYQANNATWAYRGEQPAIIDFYANWCGPCRAIAPILEELAKEYADSIIVYKVNVDKERTLAGWAQIESIPAVLFIPMQGTPQMLVGQQDKEIYQRAIRECLLKK